MSQLANAPALAGQFLQSAASMLQKPAAPAAAPAPAPTATASFNMPPVPSSAPLTQAVGTVPPAAVPGATSQVPLLNQLPLPNSIASIAQNIPGLGANAATAPAPAPTTPPVASAPGSMSPSLNPFSALP